ncbi:MAG TPA: TetR/AcrR family transcriptional regulator [Pseudomonas sp.]|nr:TetR family transcriptional regulator [Pseudomonas sp.]MBB51577.1 TetR family transcriptional regulator [Pseudomonadales bacterium]MBU30263.1 TetR family transcriptional regulator [Pseudomonadales bacterium]HCA23749.1 TetR/AcrR family transcriptional regulator [Pseudomonas sp.]|tara:strand:+ start:556 stop:1206 length:651 start_codon:yes stop_codon:yes gene_type:complete
MSSKATPSQPRNKPLKRPTQARAKVTVQAIFDTYVRIWQRDGWERITTRAVALEAGVAVGTLYDYFPSKQALHSGYVRHCIERLLAAVQVQAVEPAGLSWQARVTRLVHLLGGVEDEAAWFHPQMLELEPVIAEAKHQQRAYNELLQAWRRVLEAASDLPAMPSDAQLEALHLMVWGARRYALLVELPPQRLQAVVAAQLDSCLRLLAGPGEISDG